MTFNELVLLTPTILWSYALKSLYTMLWHTCKDMSYGQFKPQTAISIHVKHGNKRQKYRVILSLCFLIILYLLIVCPTCGIALKKWGDSINGYNRYWSRCKVCSLTQSTAEPGEPRQLRSPWAELAAHAATAAWLQWILGGSAWRTYAQNFKFLVENNYLSWDLLLSKCTCVTDSKDTDFK